LRAANRLLSEWKGFASKFVIDEIDDAGNVIKAHVKSSLALEWLADVYAEDAQVEGAEAERENTANAVRMLTLLKEKYDPIRKNYWDYKMRIVTEGSGVA